MALHLPEDVTNLLGDNPEREVLDAVVHRLLGDDADRKVLEAVLLHLIRSGRVSVAWAGARLGLDRWQAIEWVTSHGEPWTEYTEQDFEEDLQRVKAIRKLHGR